MRIRTRLVSLLAVSILMVSTLMMPMSALAADSLIKVTLSNDIPSASVTAKRGTVDPDNPTTYTLTRPSGANYFISPPIGGTGSALLSSISCTDTNQFTVSVKDAADKTIASTTIDCVMTGITNEVTVPISTAIVAAAATTANLKGSIYGTIKVRETALDGTFTKTPALGGTKITLTKLDDTHKTYSYTIPLTKTDGKYAISDMLIGKYSINVTGTYNSKTSDSINDFDYVNSSKTIKAGRHKLNITAAGKITEEEEMPVCAADNFAWIICPVVWSINEGVIIGEHILESLLKVKPLSSNTSGDLYKIWSSLRGLADIIFVLVFLVVIFGTNLGLNNYTVKKILPRLVVAAILVQISYYIAGFVIDLGNILGGGMLNLADSAGLANKLSVDFASGEGLLSSGIIAGLALAGPFMISLTAFFVATIALIVVIVTLLIRQVLITTLVILSPLAFVAWILPNTEKIFKLWWQSLFKAVMLYPMIMLLFIAGKLFALTIQDGSEDWASALAVIAYALPLLLVPMTFKAAGSLFNMASKGVGKVGGAADEKWGAGGMGDKKRTAKRTFENSEKALVPVSGTTKLGRTASSLNRRIASKRAGFSFTPNARQSAAMVGVVRKEESALIGRANRDQAEMTPSQLEQVALTSTDKLTARAAIMNLADKGEFAILANVLEKKFDGNNSDPEWKKATDAKAGDMVKTDPHLVVPADKMAAFYGKMGAEKVIGLTNSGFQVWLDNVPEERRQDAGARIAQSSYLQGQLPQDRREAINTKNGASMAGGEHYYIPAADEVDEFKKRTEPDSKQKSNTNQTQYNPDIPVGTIDQLNTHLADPINRINPAKHAAIRKSYKTNNLYKQSVDHALFYGNPIPPPLKPTMVDLISQGEIIIPGDDRSIT